MYVPALLLQADAVHLRDHNGFLPDLRQYFPDAPPDPEYVLHSVKTSHVQISKQSDSSHNPLLLPRHPGILHSCIADTTAAQFPSLSFSFPVSVPKVSSSFPLLHYIPFSLFHIDAAPAQASSRPHADLYPPAKPDIPFPASASGFQAHSSRLPTASLYSAIPEFFPCRL